VQEISTYDREIIELGKLLDGFYSQQFGEVIEKPR
jgi:hypothetical protein